MNKFDVPVLFCTFNRIDCTKKVFTRIREKKPVKLYLLSDGPRKEVKGENEKVLEVRKYVEENIDWECQVYTNYASVNMGCGKRMASGISWAFEQEEELIILEDDCMPDVSFFDYCKELLNLYRHEERVFLIGGSNSLGKWKGKDSFGFSPFVENWGWATWKRAWKYYDYNISEWKDQKIPSSMKRIMDDKAIRYYCNLFDKVYTHEIDTWDYQLQYMVFQKNMLTIVPNKCLVKNIGFGPDATHTKESSVELYSEDHEMVFPMTIPLNIKNNDYYNECFLNLFVK